MKDQEHMFEYPYNGKIYCIKVMAGSADEARDRIRMAASGGIYVGTVVAEVPASAGPLVKLATWARNAWKGPAND